MDLAKALRVPSSPCLAFVGAGGKSTALFQLARLLSGPANLPVIVTATTHLHIHQIKLAGSHWIAREPADLADLETNLQGVLLVTGPIEAERTTGVSPTVAAWLRELCGYHDIPLLIEADGSRQHPLKAPAAHEPAIPAFVDSVVVVAGLSGIGKPLNEQFVHRPEIFSQLSGLALNQAITSEALSRFLLHPDGGLKNIPPGARKIVLLNQADTPALEALANALARSLIPVCDSVITAALSRLETGSISTIHSVQEPIAGIILAAGESSRFGEPKQLLDYHGKAFVQRVAQAALTAGLSPVLVVTGAHAQKVASALAGLPVRIAHNGDWANGQSSSIRTGLERLPANTGACVFLLSDQPQVTPAVMTALVEKHMQELPAVVAPLVAGRRANPVLFDRVTFPDLMALSGDVGGRAIFSKYPPVYLDWMDEGLLIDIDTPADLQKLKDGF